MEKKQGIWVYGLAGVIGNDIWHRFDITFDFPNGKLYLKKNSLFGDAYEASKTGLSIKPGDDQKTLLVFDIAAGSAAEKAGFHIGDILLQIDELDLHKTSIDDGRTRFRSPGTHHVIVQRDGQPVDLVLIMGHASTSPKTLH